MQFFENTTLRLHQVALARARPVGARHPRRPRRHDQPRRPAARHRLLGRHDRRLKFDQPSPRTQVRGAVASHPGREGGAAVRRRRRARDPRAPARDRQGGGLHPRGGRHAGPRAGRRRRISASSTCSAPRSSGPVIGADLQRKGIFATFASILGITIYIALRFRPSFAAGAIVATLHDILVTLAFLAFFGYDLSLNVVAALLTITGYSVNDTIVIFDRVRENLRQDAARGASRPSSTPA